MGDSSRFGLTGSASGWRACCGAMGGLAAASGFPAVPSTLCVCFVVCFVFVFFLFSCFLVFVLLFSGFFYQFFLFHCSVSFFFFVFSFLFFLFHGILSYFPFHIFNFSDRLSNSFLSTIFPFHYFIVCLRVYFFLKYFVSFFCLIFSHHHIFLFLIISYLLICLSAHSTSRPQLSMY